ncbi:MAG: hypothetical protein WDM78_18910 [Puia sp.]
MKSKGFPVYKKEGSFGDLFVTYNVLNSYESDNKTKRNFLPNFRN